MSNDELTSEREELKRQLAAGKYKTLIDVILDWVSRLIQRATRGHQPVPVWYSATFILLTTILIGLLAVALLGEFTTLQRFVGQLGPFTMLVLVLATASMVFVNLFIADILTILRKSVLDVVESTRTLDEIKQWLAVISMRRLILIVSVVGGVAAGAYASFLVTTTVGYSPGNGLALLLILFGIQSAVFVLYLFFIADFSVRIGRFELKLFRSDPSSSEIIAHLSGVVSSFVYLVAVYGAVLILGTASLGLLGSFGIVVVALLWVPILVIFATHQIGLARVIQRAKWKTLNAIQATIDALRIEEYRSEKEMREAIVWFLDYHDRVRATRNSALDLRASLNFLNSLLLPLLAFILTNLDIVVALFP